MLINLVKIVGFKGKYTFHCNIQVNNKLDILAIHPDSLGKLFL